MTKRFCDTEIWAKDWFLNLSLKQKLLVKYLFDNCDCAGIYEISYKTLRNCFDTEITREDFAGIKQVRFLSDSIIFIEDFVLFQCGIQSLKELNPNNNAHKGIIKRLKKYSTNLAPSEGLASPLAGAQEKEKEKEKDTYTQTEYSNLDLDSYTLKEKEKQAKEKEKVEAEAVEGRRGAVSTTPGAGFHYDPFFDDEINKVFELYKRYCVSCAPLKFENRTPERLFEVREFLDVVGSDFSYIEELFKRANRQKTYYKNPITFKCLIKNHSEIYAGVGAKEEPQGGMAKLEALANEYRARDREAEYG